MHIGKTDDNKQIAVHYRNKAILLLNFTINILLQPKPGSQKFMITQLYAKITTFCKKDFQNMKVKN